MCGSWCLPGFLFRGGSLTLIDMACLMVLVMPWDSLSILEKLSSLTCSFRMVKDGGGALRCSLYLSPKFLLISPMYSIILPGWSHLYLCKGAEYVLFIYVYPIPMLLVMDNSYSPSVGEQLSQGPSFSYNTFVCDSFLAL